MPKPKIEPATEAPNLTLERLREVLDYDPQSGVFRWRKPPRRKSIPDLVAGGRSGRYVLIGIDQTIYYAHRLAWFYSYGKWPLHHTDHINGNGRDNRLANLREATCSENLCNRKAVRSDSTVGFRGVSRKRNKFYAQIRKGPVRWHLGTFDTPEEAHVAYRNAAVVLHGEFAERAKL